MFQFLRIRKIRMFLLVILLIAGFAVHYLKYNQILPEHLMKIVELIKRDR